MKECFSIALAFIGDLLNIANVYTRLSIIF